MTQLTQIAPLPFLYINDMVISVASNTTLSVTAGKVRDSGNNLDIITDEAITINAAVNGVNGLDTGSFAASTWYYVYAIADSQNYHLPGFIISTDDSSPLMPSGYDAYRKLGYALSDGSTHFLPATVLGNGTHRRHVWKSGINVLSSGTASTTAYVAVDCSAAIPPADYTFCVLDVTFTPNAAEDQVLFRPTGSTSTQFAGLSGVVASKAQRAQLQAATALAAGVSKLDYRNTAASGATTVYVLSFEYDIA